MGVDAFAIQLVTLQSAGLLCRWCVGLARGGAAEAQEDPPPGGRVPGQFSTGAQSRAQIDDLPVLDGSGLLPHRQHGDVAVEVPFRIDLRLWQHTAEPGGTLEDLFPPHHLLH